MKKPEEIPLNLTPRETAKLFLVSTVTIANWVKEGFLEMDGNHRITSESIRKFKKKYAGKAKLQSRANKSLKDGHDAKEVGDTIRKALLEKPFDDRLGDRYEAMLSESYKNKEGVFYVDVSAGHGTFHPIIRDDVRVNQ